MLALDLPILREVELVLVWTVHTLFEYAQFPLLENQFVSSIHKCYFGKIRSAFMSQHLEFCYCEQVFFFSFQKRSWSDSCLTLGQICAFCDIQATGFPVLAKNWLSTLKQAFSLWVKACNRLALASRSWSYSGEASEFLVCTSSISASGCFASLSPRL